MRTGSLVVAATLLLALAGCVPTDGHPSPSLSASATPVFASDAEALAAAEKAYAAYLKVSDEVGHDGGNDPERFSQVVTAAWLSTEVSSAHELKKSGRHQTGITTFSPLQMQQWSQDDTTVHLVAYTCLDSTDTRFLDANNQDVTPSSRQPRLSIEVSFVSAPQSPSHLLVDSNEPWSGQTFC